jgi:hypothetical protein
MNVFIVLLLAQAPPPEPEVDHWPHLPPLSDLKRLPNEAAIQVQRDRHWQHLNYLQSLEAGWLYRRSPTQPLDQLDRWIQETRDRLELWELLGRAWHEGDLEAWPMDRIPDEERREHLGKLRDRLGPWQYDQGLLPWFDTAWYPPPPQPPPPPPKGVTP